MNRRLNRQDLSFQVETIHGGLHELTVTITAAERRVLLKSEVRSELTEAISTAYKKSGVKLISVSIHESAVVDVVIP